MQRLMLKCVYGREIKQTWIFFIDNQCPYAKLANSENPDEMPNIKYGISLGSALFVKINANLHDRNMLFRNSYLWPLKLQNGQFHIYSIYMAVPIA